jgi:hypothetical protein
MAALVLPSVFIVAGRIQFSAVAIVHKIKVSEEKAIGMRLLRKEVNDQKNGTI